MKSDFDLSQLSPAERILLAEDLWDSLAPEWQATPLSAAQQQELNRRLEAADRGELTYSIWPEIKSRLLPGE
jgi:putative addiction module component (TIGR02574 family)